MFRAAYRSSSGALTVFAASGLRTHVVTGRTEVCVGTQLLDVEVAGRCPTTSTSNSLSRMQNQRLPVQF